MNAPALARASTTSDPFSAVAEPRRREILDLLVPGGRSVNDIVERLGMSQPTVSKHLKVLRENGLVDVRDDGRQRFYRVNAVALKPIHDWVAPSSGCGASASPRCTPCWRTSSGSWRARSDDDQHRSGRREPAERHPDPGHPRVRRPPRRSCTGPPQSWSSGGGPASGDRHQRRDRPPGRRHLAVVMEADGGFEVAFHGQFREIVPNERIVSTEVYEGMPEAGAVDTITFTKVDGRTTMTLLVDHETKEHRDAHIDSGVEGGMQDSMDALEQVARSLA